MGIIYAECLTFSRLVPFSLEEVNDFLTCTASGILELDLASVFS